MTTRPGAGGCRTCSTARCSATGRWNSTCTCHRPAGRCLSWCTCTAAGGGAARVASRYPCWDADFYDTLAAQGFAVAAIDYRLSGEARFPAPLEDVRTAVGWVRDHAASYRLDAGRIFLWGDSSGGHLALLAALTGAAVQGVVAWFPVTDWPACRPTSRTRAAFRTPGRTPARRSSSARPRWSIPDLAGRRAR